MNQTINWDLLPVLRMNCIFLKGQQPQINQLPCIWPSGDINDSTNKNWENQQQISSSIPELMFLPHYLIH